MKFSILLSIILLMPLTSSAQIAQRIPEQLPEVSEEDYRLAVKILEETFADIKKDKGEYDYVNYWNLAVAYAICQQSPDEIAGFLRASRELHPLSFSLLLSYDEARPIIKEWRELLGDELYTSITEDSIDIPSKILQEEEERIARVAAYSDFQCELQSIYQADKKYRSGSKVDMIRQDILDEQNLARIDSLYAKYGTYIGEDLAGKDLAHVMWLVIQHSNLTSMKHYFPVIQKAVVEKQLGEGPLKMLIDRICWLQDGVQLYGSQIGIPLATGNSLARLKAAYPLVADPKPAVRKSKQPKPEQPGTGGEILENFFGKKDPNSQR